MTDRYCVATATDNGSEPSSVSPPTSIAASAVSESSIKVTVGLNHSDPLATASPYSFYYVIERSLDEIAWQAVSTKNYYTDWVSLGDHSVSYDDVDTGLAASTTYYYRARVITQTSYGNSEYTQTASATTQGGVIPPAMPNQIFVEEQRVTEIDLWWDAVSGATSYVLERALYANFSNMVPVYSGDATSVTDSGLSPGTMYAYRLKAVNAGGESIWSPMVAVPTRTYDPPTNLTVSLVTVDSVELSWTSESEPVSHRILWSPNGVDSWTEIQTGPQTSYVVEGLAPNTTYRFRVRAWYASTNTAWSEIVAATTLSVPPEPVNSPDVWSIVKRLSQRFEVKTGCRL